MSTETIFMAVRSINGAISTPDANLLHHYDASCVKCHQTYEVWGPPPVMDEDSRQDRETWLTEYLPNVCPFHKDAFPVPGVDTD